MASSNIPSLWQLASTSKPSFSSASFRKRDEAATQEKRSGVRRGGLDGIQSSLEKVQDRDLAIPRTSSERAARGKQRAESFENRKKWRKERLQNITNQWADNRLDNSGLQEPRRASWVRSGSYNDLEEKKCGYLLCCFG